MRTTLWGGLAGLMAGLMTSLLWFVDYGPGNSLHTVARWLQLDSAETGRQVGFLLWLGLCSLFGVLFGLGGRLWHPTLGTSLGWGLVTGALAWVLIVFAVGTVVFHTRLDFGGVLYTSIPLLVYGLVLGSIAFQFQVRRRATG